MPVLYKDKKYKEIFCKNDNCRKLMGYESVREGEMVFVCPGCGTISHYIITRGQGQMIIEQIENKIEYQVLDDSNKLKSKVGE